LPRLSSLLISRPGSTSYTDDAIFVGPGAPAIEGRSAFLDAAPQISISSMEIAADSTLGTGEFAATLGRATWVSGPQGSDAPRCDDVFSWSGAEDPTDAGASPVNC